MVVVAFAVATVGMALKLTAGPAVELSSLAHRYQGERAEGCLSPSLNPEGLSSQRLQ